MNPTKSLAFLLLAFAAACGGAQGGAEPAAAPAPEATTPAPAETAPAAAAPAPAETAPAPAPAAEAAPAAGTAKSFDDMSHDEQIALMKNVVMPKMKPLFQAHDGKEFAEFGCSTCHGPGAKQGKFDMPNPALPKLDFTDNLKVHMQKTPAMTKFMQEQVLPEMAKALNEPMYDPKTQKGFACLSCHEAKK